jgi:hypothetical protein
MRTRQRIEIESARGMSSSINSAVSLTTAASDKGSVERGLRERMRRRRRPLPRVSRGCARAPVGRGISENVVSVSGDFGSLVRFGLDGRAPAQVLMSRPLTVRRFRATLIGNPVSVREDAKERRRAKKIRSHSSRDFVSSSLRGLCDVKQNPVRQNWV